MAAEEEKTGPLRGLVVIEMAGIGPVPLAGLILSEMGATVVRIERHPAASSFLPMKGERDLDRHGRASLALDLKSDAGRALLLKLIARADILIEGFRPGVMERLGAGPEPAFAVNPGLVYGRMTGFGQDGPLAARAGHDMTYLALTGALHAIGRKGERPVPPLNLVADYGGGTMFLVAGVLAALVEKGRSGKGQVVDAAMVDGASMLMAPTWGMMSAGYWRDQRGSNLLDGACPFYDTYETGDGGHVAVACLEPQFFAEFARLLPLDEAYLARQYDPSCWEAMRDEIAARLRLKSRDEWASRFEGTDACVAPVLSMEEAARHPHNVARDLVVASGPVRRPAPAPRFSRTPSALARFERARPAKTLALFGLEAEADDLVSAGVIGE
ncbi:MAG: CoA transferase [Rhizobiaceae bacterium]|nr:CoA transferase [Rhizobiaceae bacterium]MCV0407767.1 CoA transferase [Rhizobiaceae bacterium]